MTPAPVAALALLCAGTLAAARLPAQDSSPLARIRSTGLDSATVGRVTTHFAPADRDHAVRLARLSEAAAAHFDRELGVTFPMHLAVLTPTQWFDPYGAGPGQPYGEPWGWVPELLMGVPASLEEGVLILGDDKLANLRRVQFVMLHEFGHLANKRYLHPASDRPYSAVRWLEEFLATYFAYAYVRTHDPAWATASHEEWRAFVGSFRPRELTLDWDFMGELPPQERGRTYAWYQNLLNLRAAEVFEEHGLDFLRRVKERLAWERSGAWTSAYVLSTLEEWSPDFAEWAQDLSAGEYLARTAQ